MIYNINLSNKFFNALLYVLKVKVAQLCLTLWDPHGLYSPWNSPGQNIEVGSSFSRDLPNPGIEPRSPASQVDSLPAEPPGKPKNTGAGSLSLHQRIFPTQESTRVSCSAGGFFTGWATRKAQYKWQLISHPKRKPEDNRAFYFVHKVDFVFPTFLMKKTWVCGFWQASSWFFSIVLLFPISLISPLYDFITYACSEFILLFI